MRSAVGEVVGLLVHCCGLEELCVREANMGQGGQEDGSDEEGGGSGEGEEEGLGDGDGLRQGSDGHSGYGRSTGGLSDGENEEPGEGLGGVVGRMRELALVGRKRTDALRHGKRAKAEMRSAFRSVLAVVEQSQVRNGGRGQKWERG